LHELGAQAIGRCSHRRQLLHDIDAIPPFLDHASDPPRLSFDAPQALDQFATCDFV
jgi:hypothetical protein